MRSINLVPGRFAGNRQHCSASIPRRSCKPTAATEHLERIYGRSSPCAPQLWAAAKPTGMGWEREVLSASPNASPNAAQPHPCKESCSSETPALHMLNVPRASLQTGKSGLERNADKSSHWQRWTSNIFHLHLLSCFLTYTSSSYWGWLNLAGICFYCHKWMKPPTFFFRKRT